jgi:hypothetical protein
MILLALFIQFAMGATFAPLFNSTKLAIEDLNRKRDWLHAGHFCREDINQTLNRFLFWLIISFVYVIAYCASIYISLQLLSTF